MDDDDALLIASTGIVLALTLGKKKCKKRCTWIRTWLARRDEKGVYNNLIQEMRLEDNESFHRYLRMNTATFDHLLELVTPLLQKQSTFMCKPLSVNEKLACTLRYLATGESYTSLQFQFRISKSAICQFVPKVFSAIVKALKATYLAFPKTEADWLKISDDIYKHWQFPNSIGAIDGKHVAFFCLPDSGSLYYNYKSFHSVVLMAVAKHNYQFLYVNVGCQGRLSDGAVFKATDLYEGITQKSLNIPKPRKLPKKWRCLLGWRFIRGCAVCYCWWRRISAIKSHAEAVQRPLPDGRTDNFQL